MSVMPKSAIPELFKKSSLWTWSRLREARNCKYRIGEEAITDLVLLKLLKASPPDLKIKAFTKREEGVNGADWEWWFRSCSNKWVGMRIQAKVINIETSEYEHLHYKKKGIFQSDKLARAASLSHPPRIPAYCLYTNWPPRDQSKRSPCSCFRQSVTHFGISLMTVSDVLKLRNKNLKALGDLIHMISPLQCILCVDDQQSHDFYLAENVLSKLCQKGFLAHKDIPSTAEVPFDSYLTDEPPSYVTSLINRELPSEDAELDDSLGGVVAFIQSKPDLKEFEQGNFEN